MICLADIERLLAQAPSGYKPPEDIFFAAANMQVPNYRKLGILTANEQQEEHEIQMQDDGDDDEVEVKMFCDEHGCHVAFNSIADYETHYNNQHRFNCTKCRYSLPTAHLLDLHISERHDNYFAACVERGTTPMYRCLLPECEVRQQTAEARKDHCIKAHKFPPNYRFNKLGPCVASSVGAGKKQKGKSAAQSEPMELDAAIQATTTTTVINNTIQQQKAPKVITFGYQRMRTFKDVKDNRNSTSAMENLDDLKEALGNV